MAAWLPAATVALTADLKDSYRRLCATKRGRAENRKRSHLFVGGLFLNPIGTQLWEAGLTILPVVLSEGWNVFVMAKVFGHEALTDEIFAGMNRFLSVDIIVLILIMALPILHLLILMGVQ